MKSQSKTLKTIDNVRYFARENLSRDRYEHDLRVAEEAVRIALMTGEDIERAELAGILHDIAREYTPEQFAKTGLTEKENAFDPEKKEYDHVLMHGMAAAEIGRREFKISDEDVLEAAAWHTTGRAGMSRIAQIVFVADYTEAGRSGEHFDIVRRVLAEKGLMAAVEKEAELSSRYWLGKNGIDPETPAEKMPAGCRMACETALWAKNELLKAGN